MALHIHRCGTHRHSGLTKELEHSWILSICMGSWNQFSMDTKGWLYYYYYIKVYKEKYEPDERNGRYLKEANGTSRD